MFLKFCFFLMGILVTISIQAETFKGQIRTTEVQKAYHYQIRKVVNVDPTITQLIGVISVSHVEYFEWEFPKWDVNPFDGEYGFIYEPSQYWLCTYKTVYNKNVYQCQGFDKARTHILKLHNALIYENKPAHKVFLTPIQEFLTNPEKSADKKE